jgi:hypothetical protein
MAVDGRENVIDVHDRCPTALSLEREHNGWWMPLGIERAGRDSEIEDKAERRLMP